MAERSYSDVKCPLETLIRRLDPEFTERFGLELPERIREYPIVRIPAHLVLIGRVLGLLSGVNRSLESRLDLARVT